MDETSRISVTWKNLNLIHQDVDIFLANKKPHTISVETIHTRLLLEYPSLWQLLCYILPIQLLSQKAFWHCKPTVTHILFDLQ